MNKYAEKTFDLLEFEEVGLQKKLVLNNEYTFSK
jgi:hypothetical protein